MIEYHADDYGLFPTQSARIIDCIDNGILNGISIMPNSPHLEECMDLLGDRQVYLTVHQNIVEGKALSLPEGKKTCLTDENGVFTTTFLKVLLMSYVPGIRGKLLAELKGELRAQMNVCKKYFGGKPMRLDSHCHMHMIPLVFDAMMQVIEEDATDVSFIRIPREDRSLYRGLKVKPNPPTFFDRIKVIILNTLYYRNWNKYKKKLLTMEQKLFSGVMYSGCMFYENVSAFLPAIIDRNVDAEVLFHPGSVLPEDNEGKDFAAVTHPSDRVFLPSINRAGEAEAIRQLSNRTNDKRRRICYVADYGKKISGGHQSLINLIENARKEIDFEPYIVCHKDWELMDRFRELGYSTAVVPAVLTSCSGRDRKRLTVIRLGSPILRLYNRIAERKALRYLKDNQIDLVHMNSLLSSDVWASAANRLGIPYIVHVREFMDLDHGRVFWDKKSATHTLKQAHNVIAISEAVKKHWDARFDIQCDVVYNGLSFDSYYAPVGDRFTSEQLELIVVGRIRKTKGQEDVVHAIEKLIMQGKTNVHLTLVGYRDSEEYEKQLKKYAQNHNLEEYVSFVDFTYDLLDYRRNAQIGITSSAAEAFGRTTVENMLGGCVCIGCNSGGTPELIEEGVSGFMYTYGDVDALVNMICMIDADRECAERIAKCGQIRAKESFGIERTAENVIKLYNSCF